MNRSTYTAVAENASAVRQIDAVVLGRCSAYQISIEKSEQSAGSDGRTELPQGTAGRPGVIDALRAGGRGSGDSGPAGGYGRRLVGVRFAGQTIRLAGRPSVGLGVGRSFRSAGTRW